MVEIRRFDLGNYSGRQTVYLPTNGVVVNIRMYGGGIGMWVMGEFGGSFINRQFLVTPNNMGIYDSDSITRYLGMVDMYGSECHILELGSM